MKNGITVLIAANHWILNGCENMRVENIEVEFKMKLPVNEPDRNGNIFTEECWKNFKYGKGQVPIMFGNDPRKRTMIGYATDIVVDDEYNLRGKGTIFFGGVDGVAYDNDNKETIALDINAIGFAGDR